MCVCVWSPFLTAPVGILTCVCVCVCVQGAEGEDPARDHGADQAAEAEQAL